MGYLDQHPSMISQFFILNVKGDSLFYKDYRRDIPNITSETFWHEIQRTKGKCGPIFNVDGVNFISLFTNDLYFVFATLFNGSPAALLELLTSVVRLVSDFCGTCSEVVIRENYAMIFELADEIINFGHPQTTVTDELKPFVKSVAKSDEGLLDGLIGKLKSALPEGLKFAEDTISSSVALKSVTDESNANNIFLDLIETMQVTVGKNRKVTFAEVVGFVTIKSFLKTTVGAQLRFDQDVVLPGHPRAEHPLPHTVVLDDAAFHSAVDLSAFDSEQVIRVGSLPIGETSLMLYRITKKIRPPVSLIVSTTQINAHRLELYIKLITEIPEDAIVRKIAAQIKVPAGVSGVTFTSTTPDEKARSAEVCEYSIPNKLITWTAPSLLPNQERQVTVRLTTDEAITPLFRRQLSEASLYFEVPHFTASSLSVHFDAVTDGSRNFNPVQWVRSCTYTNSYIIRF